MAARPPAGFRERLVAAIDAGLPLSEAATHFRVSIRTIYRWLARHRHRERLANPVRPAPQTGAGAGPRLARAGAGAARCHAAGACRAAGNGDGGPAEPLAPEPAG